MNYWLYLALKNAKPLLYILLALIGAGLFITTQVPIDAVPDITNKQVMINTKTGPLNPEQIERLVTLPIEQLMTGIAGVTEIRSLSKFGLSQVNVIFDEDVEIFWARAQIFERLALVNLPSGLAAEMAPMTTGLGEIVMYTLLLKPDSGEKKTKNKIEQLIYLKEIQDRLIRPELLKVTDVADVDTNGGYKKEIHINFDPKKLEAFGLTLLGFRQSVMALGQNVGGGYIQENSDQLIISVNNEVKSLNVIENFPIKSWFNGRPIYIKDVASVKIESTLRVGAATTAGEEAVLGTVLMRSGANSQKVANESVKAIKKIKLPENVDLQIQYSRSFLVDKTIDTVTKSLIEGALLVILILLLLIGDMRASLIVSAVIPISLIGAFVGMKLTGVSANLMSLGAIDFGLIVDGAVVLVENIIRRSSEANKKSKMDFVFDSTKEVLKPLVLGVLIIVIVYLPILFLDGIEGKMFRPMALAVLFALATSLVLTVIWIPGLAYLLLKPKNSHSAPWLITKLEWAYHYTLYYAVRYKASILVTTGLVFISAIWLFATQIGTDFIPQLNEGDMVIGLVRDTSIGIDESVTQQKMAEKRIIQFAEVESVFSRLGTPESATDPMSINFADTFVILKKDKDQWPYRADLGRAYNKDELFEAIKSDLEKNLKPQEISQTQPIEMRFNEILEGSRADVALRIYGPDLEILEKLINQSKEALEGMPGLFESQFDALTALTKSRVLEYYPDYKKLAQYQVLPSELNLSFELGMAGEEVGSFSDLNRSVPIRLHLDEKLRENLDEVNQIRVPTASGGSVALADLGTFVEQNKVTTIARSWGQRYSALSLFIKNRDIQSFVTEAQERIQAKVSLPDGYRFYWGGQFKNMELTKKRFLVLIPMVVFLIGLILVAHFKSYVFALIVFIAAPLAWTGGVFSLWIANLSLTVPALIGFIAVSGIAILNAVVLVTFILEQSNSQEPLTDAIIRGAKVRMRRKRLIDSRVAVNVSIYVA